MLVSATVCGTSAGPVVVKLNDTELGFTFNKGFRFTVSVMGTDNEFAAPGALIVIVPV